ETLEGVEPEVLASHFAAAGDAARAGEYYHVAADRAADALAFERAVRLFRTALELAPPDKAARQALQIKLAHVLASAGRGAEAAREYLAAADGAAKRKALDLRRQAAQQWLLSGELDEGQNVLRTVLQAAGLAEPLRPGWSLAWLRCRLWLRGL